MRKGPTVVRFVVGLTFLVVGLNGFFNFLPAPETLPSALLQFTAGLMAARYMLPLVAAVQVVVAILLLADRFVPLALALIAPIVVNIALVHAFLYPAGAALAGITILLYLYLVWIYRSTYRPMLAMRVDTARL